MIETRAGIAEAAAPLALLYLCGLGGVARGFAASASGSQVTKPTSVPVLVELFTSEGCSSCPPADAALVSLASSHALPGVEVIALEEHVDYWNHLGWKDPFSARVFSLRQEEYGDALGTRAVYTPQMIVDGHVGFVGSDLNRARDEIARTAADHKIAVKVIAIDDVGADDVRIRVETAMVDLTSSQPELWLAVTEDGLSTNVATGENGGRSVAHGAVVRDLRRVGRLDPAFAGATDVRIGSDWARERLRIVAFVQDPKTRRVLGATAVSLVGK